jgi:hypothetical protein
VLSDIFFYFFILQNDKQIVSKNFKNSGTKICQKSNGSTASPFTLSGPLKLTDGCMNERTERRNA